MLFSFEWLTRLCPADGGVEAIAEALTARGLTVDSVSSRGSDHVLDVDIPANRPDCLGHLGLARELAAATGVTPTIPATTRDEAPDATWASVSIDDAALCPRYTAGLVRGVRVEASPPWVVARLEACGLRPVNNVVDISNLVLLELGHPIHFFDYQRLGDTPPGIGVRLARDGETLITLDGERRRLDSRALVITDGTRPIALAGIVGGADTEIHGKTRDVLIEAAAFDPRSVRATARRLGVATDASFRFERGVDAGSAVAAQNLAARLLSEIAGGHPEPGWIDVRPHPVEARSLELRLPQLGRLLGFQPDEATVLQALGALGLAPGPVEASTVTIRVPSWRMDLEQEADLVEEVARHVGYDRIPSNDPGLLVPTERADSRSRAERCRDILAHLGFHEAFGYSMIAADEDAAFVPDGTGVPLRLTNPIAEPLARMRRSVLPGLLRAAELNLRRGNRDVRLFEVGRVFVPAKGNFPDEPQHLGLVWSGSPQPRHWGTAERELDLYDLTGAVERLLESVGHGVTHRREAGAPPAYHPGRSAHWRDDAGRTFAWAGALHPTFQERLDHPVWIAEVDLDALGRGASGFPQYEPLARVPAVTRDLSLLLAADQGYGRVLEVLESVVPPVPARFDVIDRYEGKPLAPGEVSLTVRVTLHPRDRTLTDAETESYREQLVSTLQEQAGVRLRLG